MKVVFFGTPDFAVPTLEMLVESRHEVTLVVSRPDRPVGRHQVLTPPPVVEVACAHQIECLQPKSLKSNEIDASLKERGVDAVVVVAYGKMIPGRLLEIPRHGIADHLQSNGHWSVVTELPALPPCRSTRAWTPAPSCSSTGCR